MKRNNIRIAIQKEGRLKNPSLEFLETIGLQFARETGRALLSPCINADVEILYVRHGDIAQYVQCGAADFGVIGGNALHETTFNVKEFKRLGFGACRLVLAVPENSHIKSLLDLDGERIATSYPNSLRKFLKSKKINAAVVEIGGSVELAPTLGLADAICDIVQTGNTLKEHSLKVLETSFESMAVFIESPFESKQKSEFIRKFLA